MFSFLVPRQNPAFGGFTAKDSLETDGLWDVYNKFAMGNCAEATAEKHGITREAQDAHAIESYKRAARAWEAGVFNAEIAPVTIKGKKGETIVKEDEEYKKVIFEKIPTLPTVFKRNGGTVTPANASTLNDGASALILMSAAKAKELNVKPLAKIVCKSGEKPRQAQAHVIYQHMPTPVSHLSTSLLPPPSLSRRHSSAPVSPKTTSHFGRSMKLSLSWFAWRRKCLVLTLRRSM